MKMMIVVDFAVVVFMRESSYCFSASFQFCPCVRLFVRHTGGSVKNGAR